MAFKIIIVVALISCTSGAYLQQESAASPSQIKYAESQSYDQTGPGANKQFQQQQQQQTFEVYTPRPQQAQAQPQQLASFGHQFQPQEYSQQQYFLPQSISPSQHSHANVQRPVQQPQYLYSPQPAQFAHGSQAQLLYVPQNLKQIQGNALQYESSPQHGFESQDGLTSKFQYSQPQQQVSSVVVHQPQPSPKYLLQQEPQQAVYQQQPKYLYQEAIKQPQQQQVIPAYASKSAVPPALVYQAVGAPAPKAFRPTPLTQQIKYTNTNQHYTYTH